MVEVNNEFIQQENKFLAWVEIDYVPFNDVVRIFSGYSKLIPTEEEYLQALDFLSYLSNKYGARLKCLEGPDMQEMKKPIPELINWLKEMWYANKYKEINYGVWFDLLEEE